MSMMEKFKKRWALLSRNSKSFAFTLAEVLITLGIIGVVAAMTIPTLIANYQEKVLVNKAKRGYTTLMQALNMYKSTNYTAADNYGNLFVTGESDIEVLSKLVPYMRVKKTCERYTDNECGGNYPVKHAKPRDNGHGINTSDNLWGARVVLQDGMIFSLQNMNEKTNACGYDYTYNNGTATATNPICGRIWIDTNGVNAPNRYGSDVFAFYVKAQSLEPTKSDCDINYVITQNKIIPYVDYEVGSEYTGE